MTREEAILKYEKYRGLDPFPEVHPALLNSADVFDYIKTIGMIWPYDDGQLNGVTLSLRVGDVAVYWDEKNEKVKKDIKADKEFRLKSNSIAFIQILEELRLPAYIIVRFNLRVTITYRGLLLGTGPIVDPGFVGKINIPVHNLTNNDYVFAYGEPLIEMEFTKISPNEEWNKKIAPESKESKVGVYKKWKPKFDNLDTDKRDIDYYLRRANQGNRIQSSLPPLVKKVDKSVKSVKNHLRGYNIFLIFSFVGLLAVIAQMINIFKGDIREIRNQNLEQRINDLQSHYGRDTVILKQQVKSLLDQVQRDSILLDKVRKKVGL
jgi:deoxycytidine triphosphate deaminase